MALASGGRAPLCFGATLRSRRSAWRPGKVVREAGREGSVSHLLCGLLPFGGPLRLVSFGLLSLERDPRVSPTSQLLFWLKKQGAALRLVALSAPVCGIATHGSTSRRFIGDPDEVRVAFG